MANEFSTREVFVGREPERGEFHLRLRQSANCQILHLHGSGGTGKTRLLEWIVAESRRLNQILGGAEMEAGSELALTVQALRERNLKGIRVTESLVDFYKTEIHTPLGLLNDIARQLQFKQFLQHSRKYEDKGIESPDQMKEVQARFIKEYQELAQAQMVVLLFDTFEAAGPAGESLLTELLPALGANTLVVIVGRKQLSFPKSIQVQLKSLSPLTDEDAIAFFRQRNLTDQIITDAQIKQINIMVEGRPIYLALAIDWLGNSEGTVNQLVQENPSEDLGKVLVKHILELRNPENVAILYLAHVWRSGEPELLAKLLEITEAEAVALAEKLGRYSFIKYRKPEQGFNGSCLLHDEMRDLVQQYCWPEYDRAGKTQRKLTQSVLEYYEKTLGEKEGTDVAHGRQRAKDPALRNSQVEWLYYQLQLDIEEGVQKMDHLFRDVAHQRDMAFCQQLLDELTRPEFWSKLPLTEQAVCDFRQGLILYRNEKYEEAERYWLRVIGPGSANPKYRATALMLLAELYGDWGKIDKGLEYASEGEKAYKQLLDQKPDDAILNRELGELYNNWGRLMRIQGKLDEASNYYKKTLEIYKNSSSTDVNKGRARTLNNLGFVHYLLGDLTHAKVLCERALNLRQTLNISYELGLSYNTMGMLLEASGNTSDAASMYTKALAAFDEAQSSYGRGLALINHGRTHRAAKEFLEAIKALEEAEEIFRGRDNRDSLAETLNELGCVYRARGWPGDIDKAKEYFRESIACSNDIRKVDNLTDMAIMCAQASQAQETKACLEEAEPLIAKLDDTYFRGQTYEILANLYFAEGEALQKEQPEQARNRFQDGFNAALQAAEVYVRCMQERCQLYRAEQRYRHVLDMIQSKLDICPPDEIPKYVERLTNDWQALSFDEKYNDLLKTLKIFTDNARYF